MAKGQSSVWSAALDPLNVSGNRQNQMEWQKYGLGEQQLSNQNAAISGYQNWLAPYSKSLMDMVTPGSTGSQNLWNMTKQNYLSSVEPQLEGSGILTSGTGMNAVNQGLQNLSTQFNQDQLTQYMNALFGLGKMEAAPMSAYGSGISSLFGSTGSGEQQGGSMGFGNMSFSGAK